jgi:nucleotide-binding universal stress UspA family protein
MFGKILVANDGSEGSRRALAVALAVAREFSAELHSISVKERPSHAVATVGELAEEKEEIDKHFAQVTSEASKLALEQKVDLKCVVRSGHEVETIIRYAREEGFDLLVVGFMGHSRVFERIWGGTSQNLARLAPCSVLVVK